GGARGTAGPSMSDEAVRRATGKVWKQWFAALDKAGARRMRHPEMARLLHEKMGVREWWSQMVTVEYERARGMRAKPQRPGGDSVSASRTVAVPIGAAYRAWSGRGLAGWLPVRERRFTVRRKTANRSIRMLWGDGKTTVEVMFYSKGAGEGRGPGQANTSPGAAGGQRMQRPAG